MRIVGVIVGCDLIGDALIKLPFARALRAAFPQARIIWMTSLGPTAYAGPLRDMTRTLIDDVYEMPSFLPTAKRPEVDITQAPHFDILIDTRNRWREALQARKMPHGVFIAPAWRYYFSDRGNIFMTKHRHIVARLMDMVRLAAGHVPDVEGGIAVDATRMDIARRLVPEGKTAIGFAPGAGNPVKIWPLENFIAVAKIQEEKGRVPVFLLGPNELDWRAQISASVPTALFPLQDRAAWGTPDLRIEDTVALGHVLNLAVVNDSGTSHMLAAADCRLVSLFGPTDPYKLAPQVSIRGELRAQNFGAGEEMAQIPVGTVAQMVEDILNPVVEGGAKSAA